MKHLLLLLFLLGCTIQANNSNDVIHYDCNQTADLVVLSWINDHIKDLSHQEIHHVLYILLLTHHLLQCSLDMTYYKLNFQEEALNLYSPSIKDSIHAPIKIKQNDFGSIYNLLQKLETTQHQLQIAYKQMQTIDLQVITLHPQMAQQFIDNIKTILISWSAHQKESLDNFVNVTNHLKKIKKSISSLPKYFHKMINSESLPHQSIQLFASTLSQNYHELEQSFLSWLTLNKERSLALKDIFKLSFKKHFTALHKKLSRKEQKNLLEEIKNLEIDILFV